MNEYFSEQICYDVNLFGVVDKGHPVKVCHCTYIFGEGPIHGSNVVVSLLHHLFTICSPVLYTSKTFHLHSASCAGDNKNNIFVGYFMCRVFLVFQESVGSIHDRRLYQSSPGVVFRASDNISVDVLMFFRWKNYNPQSHYHQRLIYVCDSPSMMCLTTSQNVINIQASRRYREAFFLSDTYFLYLGIWSSKSVCSSLSNPRASSNPAQIIYLLRSGKSYPDLSSFLRDTPRQMSEARQKCFPRTSTMLS